MKKKNIVLCADGTGNIGGITPDSNVYKIYNAIEIHDKENPQITFYDNGIGTQKNRYVRAFCSAFGYGFKRNVCDLYEFLARNYRSGDNIYLFGFSRGVRAFSNFVCTSGIVDGREMDHKQLRETIEKTLDTYLATKRRLYRKQIKETCKKIPEMVLGKYGFNHKPSHSQEPNISPKKHREKCASSNSFPENREDVRIKFISVWDTVSALGFPRDFKHVGVIMFAMNAVFKILNDIFDFLCKFRSYDYALTKKNMFAYQALAIDDERKSFKPLIWDETLGTNVEQVWFSGAHSNVGGGYERAGLSNVTLHWMMLRAKQAGLKMRSDAQNQVEQETNVHDRLYNSRDGLGVYFRYHPRDIGALCHNKLLEMPKIHESVLERMERETGNYSPGNLPNRFRLVGTGSTALKSIIMVEHDDQWKKHQNTVNKSVLSLKGLYGIFLELTLVILGFSVWYWIYPPQEKQIKSSLFNTSMQHIADVLNYWTPELFEGIITYVVIQNPHYLGAMLSLFLALWLVRSYYQSKLKTASENLRRIFVAPSRELEVYSEKTTRREKIEQKQSAANLVRFGEPIK